MLGRSVTSRHVWTLMFRPIFSFHPQQRCNISGWKSLFAGIHLQMLDVPLLWFKVGLHLVQSKPLSSMSLAFCSPWHFGSWSDPLLVTASSCTCSTGRQYHLLLARDKIGWFGKGGQYQTAKWLTPRSSFLKQKKVAIDQAYATRKRFFSKVGWELLIAPWLPWSSSHIRTPKQHPKTPSEPSYWRPTNWYRPRPLPQWHLATFSLWTPFQWPGWIGLAWQNGVKIQERDIPRRVKRTWITSLKPNVSYKKGSFKNGMSSSNHYFSRDMLVFRNLYPVRGTSTRRGSR